MLGPHEAGYTDNGLVRYPVSNVLNPRRPFFVLAFGLLEGPKEWGMRLCGFEPWIKVGGLRM